MRHRGLGRQGEIVKQLALTLSLILLSVAAVAQSYSDANVKGKYSVQIGTPDYYSWFKTFPCPTNAGVTFTAGGSMTTTSVASGTATFDGAGNWSGPLTVIGKENVAATAKTMSVTWNSSCQVTKVNNGHVVYLAPATSTLTGTYAINSTGTGTLTIVGQTGSLSIQLTATNGAGISTTALLTSTQMTGQSVGTGIAVLQ
jgi:hypothetical protein